MARPTLVFSVFLVVLGVYLCSEKLIGADAQETCAGITGKECPKNKCCRVDSTVSDAQGRCYPISKKGETCDAKKGCPACATGLKCQNSICKAA